MGEPAELHPGDEVEHFRILRLLGQGGMGRVYAARDLRLGRKVALKVVLPERLVHADAAARFLREARLTARFAHPHIVAIHHVGTHDGAPYVALEYLEGEDLRQRMQREGHMTLRAVARLGRAIAEALTVAHEAGVLHRDLKPENVFVPTDGRLRVLDFGLARAVDTPTVDPAAAALSDGEEADHAAEASAPSPSLTRSGAVAGTPAFMAPELFDGAENASPASDIWALGLILVQLATGRRPYEGQGSLYQLIYAIAGPEPAPLPAGLDPGLTPLVRRCLDKDPARRPAAAEVVAALTALLDPRAAAEDDDCPFPGLAAYDRGTSGLFFGRDREVDALVERLREQPVVPLVGPSGAGKSSLVLAGLVPRLLERGPFHVLRVRPGADPFGALESATEAVADTGALDETADDELLEYPRRLNVRLEELARSTDRPVLLVVDQLEELLTQGSDLEVARRFLLAVCTAADDVAAPVRVVLTLRDDFLGRAAVDDEVAAVLSRVMVLRRPGPSALREIVVRPVEARGYRYEDPELVDRMVQATRRLPACLPLLQVAGRQLWERRDVHRKLLLSSAYDRIGGVEGALAAHADDVLAALSAEQAALARRVLLRLVTDERTRRVVPLEELHALAPAAEAVVVRLVDARLLTRRSGPGGAAVAELSHEALITSWSQLRAWLDASGEEVRFVAELDEAARLWHRRGRQDSEVWQGSALSDALDRAEALQVSLVGTARDFLTAARSRDRRQRTRRRALQLAGLALLLVITVASVVTALAFRERERQVREQKLAQEVALLMTEAREAEVEHHPSQAVALLRAAVALSDGGRIAPELDPGEPLQQLAAAGYLRRVLDLGVGIRDLVVLPGGDRALVRTKEGRLMALDLATGARAWEVEACVAPMRSMVLGPDGARVAIGCEHGAVRVHAAVDGRLERTLPCGDAPSGEVCWTAVGTLLAGNRDGQVCAWTEAGAEPTWTRRLDHGAWLVRSGPRGDRAVVALFGRSADVPAVLTVLDVATGETVFTWNQTMWAMRGLALSPDETRLAARIQVAGSGESELRVWDLATGEALVDLPRERWPSELAWSPDGARLAIGDEAGSVIDPSTGAVLHTSGEADQVLTPTFSADGRLLVTGDWQGAVSFIDGLTGRVLHREEAHDGTIPPPVLVDDSLAISWQGEGFVDLWEARGAVERVLPTLAAPSGAPRRFEDGSLAVPTASGQAEIFEPEGWRRIDRIGPPGRRPLLSVWPSPDGDLLMLGHQGGRFALLERGDEGWQQRWTLVRQEGDAGAVKWDPRGSHVALKTTGGGATIHAVEDGRQLARPGPQEPPLSPRWYLDDGATLVLSSAQFEALVRCRTDDWTCSEPLGLPSMSGHVQLLPDERHLAGSFGQAVAVFDLLTGELRTWTADDGSTFDRLTGHSQRMMSFALAPGGRVGLSASADQTGRLWDLDRGRLLGSFRTERGWIQPAVLLEDAAFTLYGTGEDVLELRELPSGRLIQVIPGWDSIVGAFAVLEDRVALAHRELGTTLVRLFTDPLETVWRGTGERTNLRVCRGDHAVVPVTPNPPEDTVWAPEALCSTPPPAAPAEAPRPAAASGP